MPREGTKTTFVCIYCHNGNIEIRYAPGGDENHSLTKFQKYFKIEIRYAPGGDENDFSKAF